MDPPAELLREPFVAVGSEAAAPVHGDLVAQRPHQAGQRLLEELRLQIPHRRVHGGDGHRRHTRAAHVADGPDHGLPRSGRVHRIAAHHHLAQLLLDQRGARPGPVGEAEPAGPFRVRLGHHNRGRIPLERPIRFGLLGRDRVQRAARCHVQRTQQLGCDGGHVSLLVGARGCDRGRARGPRPGVARVGRCPGRSGSGS